MDRNRRSSRLGIVAAGLVAAMSAVGHAAVVFDGGAPDHANGWSMGSYLAAADFTLAAASTEIGSVRFWIVTPNSLSLRDSIAWEIDSNSSGLPGAAIAGGVQSGVSITPTGNALASVPSYLEYVVDFTIPTTTLSAGTYWLSLHSGPLTDQGSDTYWETTSTVLGAGNASRPLGSAAGWTDNGQELAFSLSSPVPEPSSVIAIGGICISTLLKRRR